MEVLMNLHTMNRKQLMSLCIKQREQLKHGHKHFLLLCSILSTQEDKCELVVEGSTLQIFSQDATEYLIETETINGDVHVRLLDKDMKRLGNAGEYGMEKDRVEDDSTTRAPFPSVEDELSETAEEEEAKSDRLE
jgi:hypothetical protein